MKILTILGTRPEIIRLSRVIPKLDTAAEHRVLHTGQNYDPRLNDIFFNDLDLRAPDRIVDSIGGSFAGQLAKIIKGVESYIEEFRPDRALILGDTNSALSAIVCERLGVPVFHMEAGNRCYDLRVPEEKNRKVIDAISTVNLPYTGRSRENLLREGIHPSRIHVTGNPIKEVLDYYNDRVWKSPVLVELGLKTREYILVTAHRAENVDDPGRLRQIFIALNDISSKYPVVFSCHPHTRKNIEKYKIVVGSNVRICQPFGFMDFIKLEKNCILAITDSGTVQEEMCLYGTPTITIRDTTERPETVECGSNILSGLNANTIVRLVDRALGLQQEWTPPPEYLRGDVSDTVVNIVLGNI